MGKTNQESQDHGFELVVLGKRLYRLVSHIWENLAEDAVFSFSYPIQHRLWVVMLHVLSFLKVNKQMIE